MFSSTQLSSFATSASRAETIFPFTGSAIISGSLIITGSASISTTLTAQSIVETSALRYKENIKDLQPIDAIYKLRPVTFNWKNTPKYDIGFIAEEVQGIIPELVELNENGEVEGIKYSKISTLVVKALQSQEKQIKELQEQVTRLTKEINDLKNT